MRCLHQQWDLYCLQVIYTKPQVVFDLLLSLWGELQQAVDRQTRCHRCGWSVCTEFEQLNTRFKEQRL